jgi:phosphoglycerol transferase MdoB-like AlkP superfamily enzyme
MTQTERPTEQPDQPRTPSDSLVRRLGRLLWSPRLRPVCILGGLSYLIYVLFRALLLVLSLGKNPDVDAGEVFRCMTLGFGFDSMAVGYTLLPMVLVLSLAPSRLFQQARLRKAVVWYATLATVLILSIEVIGAFFFLRYGERINWRLPYYFLYPHEVLGHVAKEYPLWATLPLIPLLLWGMHRIYHAIFWSGTVGPLSLARRFGLMLPLLGLCVLACRGGVDSRPLGRGKAYYSDNLLLDQLAMNNSYTLYDSTKSMILEGRDELDRYDLPAGPAALDIARDWLFQPQDQPLARQENPLWRRTRTGRAMQTPHVVMIVMESMAGDRVGALGRERSITPRLDQISREGLHCSRMYAVGAQTSRGLVGTLCGHPDLGGMTVLARERSLGNFLSLPGIFAERGYRTMFLNGGKPSFDNMGEFFSAAGMETIIGQDDLHAPKELVSPWGVPDEYIFDKAMTLMDAPSDRPFFSVILTISNHEPFHIPAGRVPMRPTETIEDRMVNAKRYADWALGDFLDRARRRPWFKDTVFVFVADTGMNIEYDHTQLIDAENFRIPCIFYAPGRISPGEIPAIASQTDIAPTLLAMLGGEYEHCFLGRNLLEVAPNDGFALLHSDDRLGLVRNDRLLVLPSHSKPILYTIDGHAQTPLGTHATTQPAAAPMHRLMLGLYSTAWHLYNLGIYGPPRTVLARGVAHETNRPN